MSDSKRRGRAPSLDAVASLVVLFGYDVLFLPDEQDGTLTSAEMTSEAKDLISHRGQSLRAIAPLVVAALRGLRVRPARLELALVRT